MEHLYRELYSYSNNVNICIGCENRHPGCVFLGMPKLNWSLFAYSHFAYSRFAYFRLKSGVSPTHKKLYIWASN